jgi:ATP-dependent RNA helicase DeaD
MDFSEVSVVVNYDRTENYTTYLHRIGRTARAGKPGLAVSLIRLVQVCQCPHEIFLLELHLFFF